MVSDSLRDVRLLPGGARKFGASSRRAYYTTSHFKTDFHVILNGVQDLDLLKILDSSALLRMTYYGTVRF